MSLLASPAPCLLLLVLLLLHPLPPCQPESQRSDPSSEPSSDPVSLGATSSMFPSQFLPSASYSNSTGPGKKDKCIEDTVCLPGILLPVWQPNQPKLGEQVARAVVYFASLMYMFLGVSIVADRFMASIEVITSQVRTSVQSYVWECKCYASR